MHDTCGDIQTDTVYDKLLARVSFGEMVQKTFWCTKYWRISHACIHIPMQEYYWWIKYWRFYPEIANRQNLLLATISSYTADRQINRHTHVGVPVLPLPAIV